MRMQGTVCNPKVLAASTRKDGVRLIDQHRVGEAEGPDRLRDLAQLLFGMGARVACPGAQ